MKPYQWSAFKRRLHRKIRIAKQILKVILLFGLIFGALRLVAYFYRANVRVEFVSPAPSATLSPTATPTPIPPTDEGIIKSLSYGELIWKVYGHESTWGKFDSCRNKRLFNGFGYAQHKSGYQCFSSLEEVASKVSRWFVKRLDIEGMTVSQALCYYNTGRFLDSCDYADYTLALKNL